MMTRGKTIPGRDPNNSATAIEILMCALGTVDYVLAFGADSFYDEALKKIDEANDFLSHLQNKSGRLRLGLSSDSFLIRDQLVALIYFSKAYKVAANEPESDASKKRKKTIDDIGIKIAGWFIREGYDPATRHLRGRELEHSSSREVEVLAATVLVTLQREDPDFFDRAGLPVIDFQALLARANARWPVPSSGEVIPTTIEELYGIVMANKICAEKGGNRILAASIEQHLILRRRSDGGFPMVYWPEAEGDSIESTSITMLYIFDNTDTNLFSFL